MAHDLRLAITAANTALDALTALLASGFIRIYDGARPANPQTTPAGVLLAELTLGSPAYAGASSGVAALNAVGDDTDANATTATGATFARLLTSGAEAVLDLEVGVTGADVNLNSLMIQIHAKVSITSGSLTLPKGY